jgi:hypothetical protein
MRAPTARFFRLARDFSGTLSNGMSSMKETSVPHTLSAKATIFFVIFTFFAAGYFHLTPLEGVDAWWHMCFAEYFQEHGSPVVHDPFAIQSGEQILATYPDLIPGSLFLWAYSQFSYVGMNILRIVVFLSFIVALLLSVRRRWNDYSIALQVNILVFAMAGRVLLQPDLFNYVLFVLWMAILEKILHADHLPVVTMITLLLLELIWVNTHVLFFYYGILTANIYFFYIILNKNGIRLKVAQTNRSTSVLVAFLILLNIVWMINPLGWGALQSLFINMLDPEFRTYSTASLVYSLRYVNTFAYLAIFIWFLIRIPFQLWKSCHHKWLYVALTASILVPALRYERCLPFIAIYSILMQVYMQEGSEQSDSVSYSRRNQLFLCGSVILSLFLIIDRAYDVVPRMNRLLGLRIVGPSSFGVDITDLGVHESLRETNIINQIAEPGNCIANHLQLCSSAVWHCKNMRFLLYGHAAVINQRFRDLNTFYGNIASEDSRKILDKYSIRTVIWGAKTETLLAVYPVISKWLQLVYVDPYMAVLVRRGSITEVQKDRIRRFYTSFYPDSMDAMRFRKLRDQVMQYVLLWFSAEMTGNSGDHYLAVAERYAPQENLARVRQKLSELLPNRPTHLGDDGQ